MLLRNEGPERRWLALELVGVRSNRDAVGARVRVRTAAGWQTREVSAGAGYLSGSSLVQHFGLGEAAAVEEVEIAWPSGVRSSLRALPGDRRYVVVEGEGVVAAVSAPDRARSGRTRPAAPGRSR